MACEGRNSIAALLGISRSLREKRGSWAPGRKLECIQLTSFSVRETTLKTLKTLSKAEDETQGAVLLFQGSDVQYQTSRYLCQSSLPFLVLPFRI